MNRSLALVAAAALLFGSDVHAQTLGNTGVATSPAQLPENPIVLWPSETGPVMNTPPSEGWTLPPQGRLPAEDWRLPQG